MDDAKRNLIKKHINLLIEGTNDAKLKIILDIFEERKLLNNWMLHKIRSSDNKQRAFYEMVPKRGPEAFTELLSALDKADLGNLRGTLSPLHPSDRKYNQDEIDGNCLPSNKNSELSENENNENYIPMENYVVNSNPRGIMLIINNKEFPYKKGINNYDRYGSEKDVSNLIKTGKAFGFNVKDKWNLNSKDLENYINIFVQKEILKKVDSAIIIFMSHGKKKEDSGRRIELECPDNLYVDSEWFLQQFDAIHCPALAMKPKAIFFVACRGENFETGISIATDSSKFLDNVKIVPKRADLFVVYSTSPDYVSLRDSDGTPFIKSFCEVMAQKTSTSLQEVINEVSQTMKMKYTTPIHWESFGFDKKFPLIRK